MTGLRLHHSNRLEVLAVELAHLMRLDPVDPFAPERNMTNPDPGTRQPRPRHRSHAVTSVYTCSATDHYGAQPEGVALHTIKDGRIRLLEE